MWLLLVASASAVQTRKLPIEGGPVLPAVWNLHQDEAGWIWIANLTGLSRYDGTRLERWGGPELRREVMKILAVREEGKVVDVLVRDGTLVEARIDRIEPVLDASGKPLEGIRDAAEDGAGGLWVLDKAGVRRRTASGWSAVQMEEPDELWGAPDGVWASGKDRLVHLTLAAVEDRAVAIGRVTDLALDGTEPSWAVGLGGEVWRIEGADARQVGDIGVYAFGVAADAEGAWVSGPDVLARFEGHRLVARVPVVEGIPNTGPLLLDREGSLWNGTFLGLDLRPQPSTLIWTVADGLPASAGSWLSTGGPDSNRLVTTTTWEGAGWIDRDGTAGKGPMAWLQWPMCHDGNGVPWGLGAWRHGDTTIGIWRLGDPKPVIEIPRYGPLSCATALDGGLWVGASDGPWLWEDEELQRMPWTRGAVWGLLETGAGTLWAFERRSACSSSKQALLAGIDAWECTALPNGRLVRDAIEVDSELWAVGEGTGVLRFTGSAWEPHPSNAELPTDVVFSLAPASEGGAWLATVGAVWRVRPRGDRWEILERLDAWNGLPATAGAVAEEAPDGTVWVGTAEGVVRVPKQARGAPGVPAGPTLAVVRANGLLVDGPVEVGWPHSQLELAAAVPSYRDRARLSWRFRLGTNQEWSAGSSESTLRLVDLPPGAWGVEVQASLDGQRWSAASVPIPVDVRLPVVLRPPALAAWVALLAAAGYALHRLRLAAAIRVERERTRIAMDLHDELGSGLGTLAVLAELSADSSLPEDARREVSTATLETARSLGDALSDIVWSLRRDAGSPATLGQQLADRGSRLFAAGVRFEADLPERWPQARLALAVYRNVQLIAVEALMNTSRHARATHVWLRILPGHPWILVIEDDGVGLSAPSERINTGTGLEAMRARAAAIGGRLEVTEREGGGTRVALHFQPQGGGWWT